MQKRATTAVNRVTDTSRTMKARPGQFSMRLLDAKADILTGETLKTAGNQEGYKILGALKNQGAFSTVYLAIDKRTETRVVIKVASEERLKKALNREAGILSETTHKNVVRVLDEGNVGYKKFIVLEWLGTCSLEDEIRASQTFTWKRAQFIAGEICDALEHIHEKGIIHRDLKPANIMLTVENGRETIKILDLGLGARTDSEEVKGSKTSIVGTPDYMAPEQAAGNEVDSRADLYAVGAILYRMICGEVPITDTELIKALIKKIKETPKRAIDTMQFMVVPGEAEYQEVQEVAGQVDSVVMTALERNRGARFDSAASMKAAIMDVEGDFTVKSKGSSKKEKPTKATKDVGPKAAAKADVQALGAPGEVPGEVVSGTASTKDKSISDMPTLVYQKAEPTIVTDMSGRIPTMVYEKPAVDPGATANIKGKNPGK